MKKFKIFTVSFIAVWVISVLYVWADSISSPSFSVHLPPSPVTHSTWETIGYMVLGLAAYFAVQFKIKQFKASDSILKKEWWVGNSPNIILFIVGVVLLMSYDIKFTRMWAFGLGAAPNVLIDFIQNYIQKGRSNAPANPEKSEGDNSPPGSGG